MNRPHVAAGLLGAALLLSSLPATAQAPPPPPPPAFDDFEEDEPEPPRNGFSAKVGAGPAVRALFGHEIWGGRFFAAFGAQFKDIGAVHGEFGYEVGWTDGGLKTEVASFGSTWEFILGRVRLGAGPHVTLIWMERASRDDDALSGMGLGLNGLVSVDLVQGEHANLHVGLDGRYTFLDGAAGYGGIGLALGGRFKVP